jgi:IclR family KDG regulon transcriptional repressor
MAAKVKRAMKNEEVKSLKRASQILEYLGSEPSDKSLVDISRNLGFPVATTRRLLITLMEVGFVRRNKETKNYNLGLNFLIISRKVGTGFDFQKISVPYLKELMEKSGETANLVVEDDGEAVYIEQVECSNHLRTANKVGSRAPLYCTAVGKVLLSSRLPEERKKSLADISLRRLTPKTVTRKDQLLRELETVSQKGVAIDNEEQMIGERCLAAPIRDENGKIVAAISISGPSFRLTSIKMRELKPVVVEISRKISEEMGFKVKNQHIKHKILK